MDAAVQFTDRSLDNAQPLDIAHLLGWFTHGTSNHDDKKLT